MDRGGINRLGQDGIWNEEDGFYCDIVKLPDGNAQFVNVRSLVGLLPICGRCKADGRKALRYTNSTAIWHDTISRPHHPVSLLLFVLCLLHTIYR